MAGRPPIYTDSRLAWWLSQTGRTRSSLAAELGVSGQYITDICRGKRAPRLVIALLIVEMSRGAVTVEDMLPRAEAAAGSAA